MIETFDQLQEDLKVDMQRTEKINNMIKVLLHIKDKKPIYWRLKYDTDWIYKETTGNEEPNFRDCDYKVADDEE